MESSRRRVSRLPGVQSVQRQLAWALSLAIGLVALLGAGLAFWAAYDEARELQDDAEVAKQAAEFLAMLAGSEKAADALEKALLDDETPEVLSARMKALTQTCKSCHTKYRD